MPSTTFAATSLRKERIKWVHTIQGFLLLHGECVYISDNSYTIVGRIMIF